MTRDASEASDDEARVVVITGASSGIGLATAHAFAGQGARLVLSARGSAALHRAEKECLARGASGTLVVAADVADEDAVDAVCERAVERFGRVDVWVHSAAVVAYGRFEDVPSRVWQRVVDTNVHGTANVARTSLRHFRGRDRGTLVLLGSLLGEIATPFMSSYVTSKWAVRGLARVLSIETRAHPDIHVCTVSPGGVNTPVYRQAATYAGHHGSPPPPVVQPEKVARAIVRCAENPRARVSVGPGNLVARAGFTALPAVYDLLVSPMMRLLGLGRAQVPDTEGNVFGPAEDGDGVHGHWNVLGLPTRRSR